jgi:hypothetical protein
MKALLKLFLFFSVLLISSIVFAQPIKFNLDRVRSPEISFSEINKRLSCYPSLISHWNNEQGFSNKLEVKYGDLHLVRTDVGDSDGNLIVSLKEKIVCEIELSLMPDIYYNSKDNLLLIYGYSGSNQYIELFSLSNECEYIGWASLNSQKDYDEVTVNWYNQPYGGNVCRK